MESKKSAFQERLRGSFSGVVSWEQLTALWSVVGRDPRGWYIYAVGDAVPTVAAEPDVLEHFLVEIDTLLRREHRESYCGIVYADNRDAPTFIKIFDPHNLGSSCGSSGLVTLPGWLITRMAPERIDDPRPLPESRRRWWRNLFALRTEA
ncbi:MAG: hypothetical protein ACYCXG_11710 [Acidiferrobacter sp.]